MTAMPAQATAMRGVGITHQNSTASSASSAPETTTAVRGRKDQPAMAAA